MLPLGKKNDSRNEKSNDTCHSITSIPEDDDIYNITLEQETPIKRNTPFIQLLRKSGNKKKIKKIKHQKITNKNIRINTYEQESLLNELILKENLSASSGKCLFFLRGQDELSSKKKLSGQKRTIKKFASGDGDIDSFPINWSPTVPAGIIGQVTCIKTWNSVLNCNENLLQYKKGTENDSKIGIHHPQKLNNQQFAMYSANHFRSTTNEKVYSAPQMYSKFEGNLDTWPKIVETENVQEADILEERKKTGDTTENKRALNYQPHNELYNLKSRKVLFKSNSQGIGDNTVKFTRKVSKCFKRTPSEIKFGLLLPPNRSPPKLLLAFLQGDAVSETLSRAADKLGFDVTLCNSCEGALEEFLSNLHDLIIIDTRCSLKAFDYDTLCRSVRNTKGSQHTAAVAVVKKSAFDKDDVTILSLLDTGFNRCIVETTNIIHCVNELVQLKHSDIRPLAQTATNQTLYAALEKCSDIVFVTDDSFRLQYANSASERFLGYKCDETLGKTLQEQLIQDPIQLNSMTSSLMRAREWQGPITFKRKGQDAITFTCRAMPIIAAGRSPTHFAIVIDIHGLHESTVNFDKPRGSVQSLRRTSLDVRSVGSDYLRRTSLAKLSALPLEAPITKVITLLTQAQEQTSPTVASILDKVIDLLQSTELYSPHLKDSLRLRCDEPVTSDLITALLMQQPQLHTSASSRRSSNDSTTVRSVHRAVSKIRIPTQIKELLESSLTWEFDIFRLEDLTNKKPLIHLGMNLFLHFDVPQTLNCDEKTLYNWLTVIEMNYHVENSYHNSTHAADVMQATAGFLEKDTLKSIMEPLDEATSLLAACAHDIDHPGKSSAFLSNCDNPLAILYNDSTILENHHAALTFKLTLGDDRVNIFKNLDRESYKIARHNVIDMILATEMTRHFEHLAKFVNVFSPKSGRLDPEVDGGAINQPENITLVKRMMIKCADVSNPTRPLRLCVEWARRIAEEYFAQTDEEKAKGLPVVMPMFDRVTCSIPKSQIGFVDFIVHDMFDAWEAFIQMPELVNYMKQNYLRWKEFDEQGHTTAADIRKLQNTLLMAPMFPNKSSTKRND
ncbi:hypothetical protein FQR65_LT11465 [Abscondita terminalis]|nr:hypothetical protein FQR65_LT11465 [Abscondita terminalis]